jgi:aerobic-type carbon monoxide dehydrogenase small subunit (CoxS/CutS family)
MEKGAVQCGFCTSGMIMTAKALLDRDKKPTKKDVIKTMSSNICRCTGYKKIVEAVMTAASK